MASRNSCARAKLGRWLMRKAYPPKMKKTIAKIKLRLDRGYYWVKYVRDFLIIAFLLEGFGIPWWVVFAFFPLLYLAGHLDERFGIWKAEQRYMLERISRFKKKLFKKGIR